MQAVHEIGDVLSRGNKNVPELDSAPQHGDRFVSALEFSGVKIPCRSASYETRERCPPCVSEGNKTMIISRLKILGFMSQFGGIRKH